MDRIMDGVPVFIFGAGKIGREYFSTINHFYNFVAFVDNDEDKQSRGYLGQAVFHPQALTNYFDKRPLILIAASPQHQKEIITQLGEMGFEYGRDVKGLFTFVTHELAEEVFRREEQVFNRLCQISLTERCSLKCKKCAHACNLVPNTRKDLTLAQAISSADHFFDIVDYSQEFVLIGGEPLLYKELDQIIEYIGEKYREKINIFSITTNGTILPNEKILENCKKYQVTFRISNYSKSIPRLKEQYKKLMELLDKWDMKYLISDEQVFWDYGFDWVDHHMDEAVLKQTFEMCKTPCREVQENRYYFCVMAHTVSNNMYDGKIGQGDYLNLDSLKGPEGRKAFFEFEQGQLKKGYLDMCNHCNGIESQKYVLPAGEQ